MLLTLGSSVPFSPRCRSDSLPEINSNCISSPNLCLNGIKKPVTIEELSILTQELAGELNNHSANSPYDYRIKEEIGTNRPQSLIPVDQALPVYLLQRGGVLHTHPQSKSPNISLHSSSTQPTEIESSAVLYSTYSKIEETDPSSTEFRSCCHSNLSTQGKENMQFQNILPKISSTQKQRQPSINSRRSSVNPLFNLELVNEDLWELFSKNKNEMIITRFGRCLFPALKFKINVNQRQKINFMMHNFKEEPLIAFGLQLIKTSNEKLKFRHGSWITNQNHHRHLSTEHMLTFSSSSSYTSSKGIYWHPSGVQPLSFWTKFGLAFLDAKLTNGRKNYSSSPLHPSKCSKAPISYTTGSVSERKYKHPLIAPGFEAPFVSCLSGVLFQLESFYEYTPLITCKVYSLEKNSNTILTPSLKLNFSTEYLFPRCAFIAVTHYQNPAVNRLKKQYNPHAKGFFVNSNGDCTEDGDSAISKEDDIDKDVQKDQSYSNLTKREFLNIFDRNSMSNNDLDKAEKYIHPYLQHPSLSSLDLMKCRGYPGSYQTNSEITHPKSINTISHLDVYCTLEDTEAAAYLLASWYAQKQEAK